MKKLKIKNSNMSYSLLCMCLGEINTLTLVNDSVFGTRVYTDTLTSASEATEAFDKFDTSYSYDKLVGPKGYFPIGGIKLNGTPLTLGPYFRDADYTLNKGMCLEGSLLAFKRSGRVFYKKFGTATEARSYKPRYDFLKDDGFVEYNDSGVYSLIVAVSFSNCDTTLGLSFMVWNNTSIFEELVNEIGLYRDSTAPEVSEYTAYVSAQNTKDNPYFGLHFKGGKFIGFTTI